MTKIRVSKIFIFKFCMKHKLLFLNVSGLRKKFIFNQSLTVVSLYAFPYLFCTLYSGANNKLLENNAGQSAHMNNIGAGNSNGNGVGTNNSGYGQHNGDTRPPPPPHSSLLHMAGKFTKKSLFGVYFYII